MRKPTLTIFYQFDPWNPTIGGIQTLISSFIKYAPAEFDLRFVGTTADSNLTVGRWIESEFEGRELQFMPLLNLKDDNYRRKVPTTLKYTLALLGQRFSSDFMHFHRLEPTMASLSWQGDKTLFIHNDIHQQMISKQDKNAILWRKFPAAYFALERFLLGQFHKIFSCNSNSMLLYQQRYSDIADRVTYFRNSVDDELFYPLFQGEKEQRRLLLAKQLGLPEATRFILFAGRLHPQKDPLLLVRSFAALRQPDTHLLIAGDGELTSEVESEIHSLGLSKQITMLGALNKSEVANLHRLSSLCILTSAYEGLPLVILEALACGTPIVTTRCGETPNLLTVDSGVVAEERTPVAIANAIRKVLLNPLHYPMQACTQVAEPYSARKVIKEIYSEMLARWNPSNVM